MKFGWTYTRKTKGGAELTITDPSQISAAAAMIKVEPVRGLRCPFCDKKLVNRAGLESHRQYCKHRAKSKSGILKFKDGDASRPICLTVAPTQRHFVQRRLVERKSFESVYPSVWRHLEIRQGLSTARRNVRRRNRPIPGGADGRSKNRGNTRRHRKTYGDKAHIIALFDEAVMEGVAAAASCIDKSMKLSRGECMRYVRKRRHILELAADDVCKKLKTSVKRSLRDNGHYQPYRAAEEALNRMFVQRRKMGRRVSSRWLMVKLRALVKRHHPLKAEKFKCSAGMVQKHRVRYGIVPRRRTNKKAKNKGDRLPIWRAHHHRQIKLRSNGDQVDDLYGRWRPTNTFSLDQVPCPFALQLGSTLAEKGVAEVWVKQPTAGLEKRQCTLQCMFRAPYDRAPEEGCRAEPSVAQPPGCIIFRGTGKRISAVEKAAYAKDIIVLWQPKAWVDRVVAIQHVKALAPWFKKHVKGDSIIGCDNLDAQIQLKFYQEVQQHWRANCTHPPGGSTDGLQAVDDGYGKDVKWEMGEQQEAWLDIADNVEKWEDGKLRASDRRILLTHWYSRALAKTHAKVNSMWRYHERTGSIMTVNGSRRTLLTPGGIKDYDIGVIDAQAYANMKSLTRSELMIAESEKSASKEGDSGTEPEVESDYDDETKQEIAEMHGQHHHDELVQDPTVAGAASDDDATVVDNVPVPTFADICGDKYQCSTEEQPVLKKGTMISFFWGDAEGYSLGKIVAVTSKRSKSRAFPYYVRHDGEREERGHALAIDMMATAGPSGSWAVLTLV